MNDQEYEALHKAYIEGEMDRVNSLIERLNELLPELVDFAQIRVNAGKSEYNPATTATLAVGTLLYRALLLYIEGTLSEDCPEKPGEVVVLGPSIMFKVMTGFLRAYAEHESSMRHSLAASALSASETAFNAVPDSNDPEVLKKAMLGLLLRTKIGAPPGVEVEMVHATDAEDAIKKIREMSGELKPDTKH